MKKPSFFNKLLISGVSLLGCLLFSPASFSGQVVKSFVDQQGEHYLIDLQMQIEAPRDKVYALITDYAHLDRLSDSIQSSQILKRISARETQVKLVSEGCVLFFCQTVTQVQNVHELDNDYIHIMVEPTLSDVKLNNQLWRIEAIDSHRTRIYYSADIVPDFWIPPLIGSWIFQGKLLEEATELINNVEKMANPTLNPHTAAEQNNTEITEEE